MDILISPAAVTDLQHIKSYIGIELGNPDAAKRLINKIIEKYERLSEFPLMGPALEPVIGKQTPFRFLVCENYMIFYTVEQEHIKIYRILYGKSDYINKIFGNFELI